VIESAMRWVALSGFAPGSAARGACARAERITSSFGAGRGMKGRLCLLCEPKCIHFCRQFNLFFKPHPKAAMGKLTTHVLDTANGCPAAGMAVALYRLDGTVPTLIKQLALNADGRADSPLLADAAFVPGRYRLVFGVAAYFRGRGTALSDPPFLDEVPLDFGLAEIGQHYHVPLLASPFAYSTYRGS
jgi:5-hydroxyisourate hydrolase